MFRSSSHPVHAFPSLSLISCARLFILSLLFQYNSPKYFVNALHRPSVFDHIAAFDQPDRSASRRRQGSHLQLYLQVSLVARSVRLVNFQVTSPRWYLGPRSIHAASISNPLRRGPTQSYAWLRLLFYDDHDIPPGI